MRRCWFLISVRQAANLAETICAAKVSFPDAAVVVISGARNRDLVISALALGAATFIDEDVATSTLIKELQLAVQRESVISVSLIKPLLARCSGPTSEQAVPPIITLDTRELPEPEDDAKPHLSGREIAILTALAQGAPNKVIAYRLSISEATVKVHIKAILRKIQVKNRTQAAIWPCIVKPSETPKGPATAKCVRPRGPERITADELLALADHGCPRLP